MEIQEINKLLSQNMKRVPFDRSQHKDHKSPKNYMVKVNNNEVTQENVEKAKSKKQKEKIVLKHEKETSFQGQWKCKYYHIVYKTHINKEILADFLTSKWELNDMEDNLVISHESSDKRHSYDHTHVAIAYEKERQVTCRSFDINIDGMSIHPHFKKITVSKARPWQELINYLAKQDNQHLYKEITSVVRKIQSAKSKTEALENNMNDVKEATNILAIYNAKEEQVDMGNWKPNKIQQQMMEKINAFMEDKRHEVLWFEDARGRTGKTNLAKALMATKTAIALFLARPDGDIGQLMASLSKYTWWDRKYIVLNLPKNMSRGTAIYNIIESLNDGAYTTLKYAGNTGVLKMENIKIVVFSNERPNTERLSKGKIKIQQIKAKPLPDEKEEETVPIED